jgi:hypothetical protein
LKAIIATATDPDSLTVSTENTGREFRQQPPRVFIVSSVCGGTGSGAVLDLAYTVRTVMRELEVSDCDVNGILTFATSDGSSRDLSVANAVATLGEMRDYSDLTRHYPGESCCDLPPFLDNNETFSNAYCVNLGDQISAEQYTAACESITQYLYLNVATPACAFFDKSRQLEHAESQSPLGEGKLRTFGISLFGGIRRNASSGEQSTLRDWLATASPSFFDECGGASRLLLTLPNADEKLEKGVQRESEQGITFISGCGDHITACFEVEQMPIQHLLHAITQGRPDFAEIAARLHTRIDVDWSPIG